MRTTNENHTDVKTVLQNLKDKWAHLDESLHPTLFFVDNASDSLERMFQQYFKNCKISQDIKHFVNRLIEHLVKSHCEYTTVCTQLHGAFTSKLKIHIIYTVYFLNL